MTSLGTIITLTPEEQENLLRAIESSLRIRKRYQFFLWTQGSLHALIPHEVLVCVVTRDDAEILMMDRFNSCIVPDEVFEEVCGPVEGLVMQTLLAWRESGDSPCLLSSGQQLASTLYPRFRAQLERAGFDNAVGHGSANIVGSGIPGCFYFFARLPDSVTLRHAYFLELLLPHIHMAYLRTLAYDGRPSSPVDGSSRLIDLRRLLTEREVEILGWVQEGKSNLEIGAMLSISPLTVKNHVQKVLRKLNVRNRAQAVSKATALRIIGYDSNA